MSSIGQGSISIDDSARIGQNAQDTANEVAGNVNDINSDNKLTPSEKLKLKQEYDKDVELYNIDIEQLKSVDLPTAELETAMSNLTDFVTPLFKEMNRTSTVDRGALDSVFTTFATADKNASQAFANKVQQVADGAKKAGDDAKEAGEKAQAAGEAAKQAASQAQADATKAKSDAATAQQKAQSSIDQLNETSAKFDGEITEAKTSASQAQSAADNAFNQAQAFGSQATSAIAVQSAATAKAQSSANNALSSASSAVAKAESTASEFGKVSQKADSAFDNALSAQSDASAAVAQASSAASDSKDAKQIAGAVSQSYKTLTDGSTMTIAELQNGLAAKLTKSDLNGYATETWAQNKIKMTADGINGTVSSVKSTVDGHDTSINDLKADSSSFKSQFTKVNNTLSKQTTDIGTLQASSKELSSNFNSLSTDNNTNKNDISQLKQTATEVSSTLETVQTQVKNSAVGINLAIGTGQEYLMGFGIPNTVWQDGYAYEKLPLSTTAGEILPQDPNSFHYTLTKGTTYTQTIWLETDATVKDFSAAQITWYTSAGHDAQPATVVNLGGNKYKIYSTYTWPDKGDNNVRLFDIFSLASAFDLSTGTYLKFGKLKLEKGSLSTDWCPNPADTATKSQITQLSGEIAQKVDSGDFSSYKTQTANDIASKVSSNDFESYKTQTDSLIGSKVDNSDFSTYKTQTATAISSKVANNDFSSYKTETAQLIGSKVESKDFSTYKTQTANLISQTVSSAVDGLKIGGTNLIKNSKFDDKMNNWRIWCPQGIGTSTVEINPTGGGGDWPRQAIYSAKIINTEADKNNQFGIAQDSVPVEPNAEYTFQLFNDGADPITVQHGNGSNDPYVAKVLGSHRTTWTFKIPADVYNTNIYIGFNAGQSGTAQISLTKLEKGNKPTDWSSAPEDLATSTEIDQINNAIKLKADSNDVTSQITVATQGIQSEVDNKVTDLTTQINQTSDAVQILNTTSGLRNLVYNSSYANNAEGWDLMGIGYLSTVPASSFNGSPGLGISVSDKKETDFTMFAKSKPYKLPSTSPYETDTNNVYSAQAKIKLYGESKVGSEIIACLSYLDANGSRISGWKDMAVKCDGKNYNQWITVKFENYGVPKNAVYVAFYYWGYGNVHGMIVEPMIVFGPKVGPYNSDAAGQSDITTSINNIHMGIKGADGSTSTFNMNNDTILLDANKIIFNGNTSIQNGTIGTAKIANAAINTAQIADGAINNAKIANASIDDAKISNLNGNKIIARSITANKINVDDLIANGINTKTLTSVNLNTSTLITPQLDLGLNGTFTEDFDYTQPTSLFLPKKNKGTLTFNHGVLQSEGNMQTYVGGQWGGMNDNLVFQSGINNAQWTEVAPGYLKMDLYKQDGTTVAERTYSDPTGFYYTSAKGDKSYLGNVLQTGQVQTPSIIGKYIGPMDGQLRLQIGSNGDHYGLQVGSYAGSEAVMSDFIYSFTSSNSSNVRIADSGRLMRTTSASKYKYNIKNPEFEKTLGDRLLNVHMATWNDKHAVDMYADQLTTGEDREKISIKEHYGLIAEQMRDAGLEMFIDYGKNHEIEGIQYDRAWIPLLSVVRRLNDKVNEYELRLSKLEGANK